MEEETTMMIPPQGMDEDMGEGIASLPEQGDSGIADLPQAAQQLAQLGRAQDTFLGHLAQDEIVIPLSLLQASPELEDVIRNAFEAEGMDYSQYVVGSDENSINPETGLPEFGLGSRLKRGLKSAGKKIKGAGKKLEKAVRKPVKKAGRQLEKAVRKPIKKVARELKRAAPVVLPVALTLLAGPNAGILQQMLLSGGGSGISTLLAGGDFKDALKNAAISAAITGAISGTQQALAPKELAQEGVKEGVKTGTQGRPELFKVPTEQLPPPTIDTGVKPTSFEPVNQYSRTVTPEIKVPPKIKPTSFRPDNQYNQFSSQVAQKTQPPSFMDKVKSAYQKTADFVYPTGEGSKAARDAAMDKYLERGIGLDEAKALANKEVGYSALRQYAVPTALGVGALYASGAFKTPEEEMDPEYVAMQQQLAEDRAIAANIPQMGDPAGIDYITAQQTLAGAPNYQYLNPLYQGGYFLNNPTLTTGVAMARRGGEMAVTNLDVSKFPRRTGRISGPGTETSDSIPAMLSDGEFVMNARAVRGAGNGSREAGVRKMYDMMRNFESKVA